jgi:hypothetical protein
MMTGSSFFFGLHASYIDSQNILPHRRAANKDLQLRKVHISSYSKLDNFIEKYHNAVEASPVT